jgi:catechol-2,3-dioxygenase
MNTVVAVPPTAKERGKIAPAKFAHIVLRTSRFEEMMTWYKTVLEVEVVLENPMVSFLTYDDEHHRLAIANMPDLKDRAPQTAGVEHVAYTYETLDDLFATYERIKAAGIEPYWCINHGITLSMYYRDPDNNQIELQVDIFENPEATNDWLAQSDFDVNFLGVKFDPVELIQRYRDGESRDTLLARPTIDASEVFDQLPEGGL